MSWTKDKQIVIDQLTGDNLKQIVKESCDLQLEMIRQADRLAPKKARKVNE